MYTKNVYPYLLIYIFRMINIQMEMNIYKSENEQYIDIIYNIRLPLSITPKCFSILNFHM